MGIVYIVVTLAIVCFLTTLCLWISLSISKHRGALISFLVFFDQLAIRSFGIRWFEHLLRDKARKLHADFCRSIQPRRRRLAGKLLAEIGSKMVAIVSEEVPRRAEELV